MSWIMTASGLHVNPFSIGVDDISIEDMAHHLAVINRYTGATREPYSVGQHSVLMARAAPDRFKLRSLFHDGSEYLLGDPPRPLKELSMYKELCEEHYILQNKIYTKVGLTSYDRPTIDPGIIETLDLIMLKTEFRDLMSHNWDWLETRTDIIALPEKIVPWTFQRTKKEFLITYHRLMRATHAHD